MPTTSHRSAELPTRLRLQDCVSRSKTFASLQRISSATRLRFVLFGLLVVVLSGCAPKRLRVDFTGFEKAYAETSNREVLLNLARLENRDPTYFFKIGQITSSYKMQASLTGTASYALQSSNVNLGAATGGGTPLANYENDPIFTFIPVNDETNAQLLLKPVPPETFYFLYEQGWRVDQLLRLMVDRIELTRFTNKDGVQHCAVQTIRNAPPTVYLKSDGTPDLDYLRDPVTLSSYVTFLRINAVVYWLQKHGYLLLRGQNRFVPYSVDIGSGVEEDKAPSAQEIVSASQKNAVWEHDVKNKKWLLGEKVFTPMFSLYPLHSEGTTLVPDGQQIEDEILNDPDMKELKQGAALQDVLESLTVGFSIEGNTRQEDLCNSTSEKSGVSAHLVMRSLIGLMAAAAQEQVPYEMLLHSNPTVPPSTYFSQAKREEAAKNPARFIDAVPSVERIPLLRLRGVVQDIDFPPVVELKYRGKDYRIADEKSGVGTDNQYWNRDMFRLIDQLTSQVTVDISKFPLTEILQ
ncbi:hypothetical protein P8935_05120 [Telmatobacter sp. DSM 110680]|uniref:Uncharacterized protein n=1 Tax=Telmatobacter sp. DSM 110680 TaxID=3036704 RepID=A0AAU7DN29_9BACT